MFLLSEKKKEKLKKKMEKRFKKLEEYEKQKLVSAKVKVDLRE